MIIKIDYINNILFNANSPCPFKAVSLIKTKVNKKKLSLLDAMIKYFDSKLFLQFETAVNRNSTFTGKCLNFHSSNTIFYKNSVFHTLVQTVKVLC